MKAWYCENNGYNAVLLVSGDKFISIDEVIDGVDITRSNIERIASGLAEAEFNDSDFATMFDQAVGTLVYGDNATDCLDAQDYTELIYES